MRKNLLLSKMKLFEDTNATLAKKIGCSPQRFSAKLNETHGATFTQKEISIIKETYSLTSAEIVDIFFSPEVS